MELTEYVLSVFAVNSLILTWEILLLYWTLLVGEITEIFLFNDVHKTFDYSPSWKSQPNCHWWQREREKEEEKKESSKSTIALILVICFLGCRDSHRHSPKKVGHQRQREREKMRCAALSPSAFLIVLLETSSTSNVSFSLGGLVRQDSYSSRCVPIIRNANVIFSSYYPPISYVGTLELVNALLSFLFASFFW